MGCCSGRAQTPGLCILSWYTQQAGVEDAQSGMHAAMCLPMTKGQQSWPCLLLLLIRQRLNLPGVRLVQGCAGTRLGFTLACHNFTPVIQF